MLARVATRSPAEARAWREKHQAIQVNHVVTVKTSLSREHPDVVREVWRMLAESKRAAGPEMPCTGFVWISGPRSINSEAPFVAKFSRLSEREERPQRKRY